MEAGKRRLAGDTSRSANTDEVRELRREARDLKECVADLTLENRLLKKSMIGDGATTNEISRLRKTRDHQTRRTLPSTCQANPRQAGHRPAYLLPLV